jgi:glycosyltransferase involved in cell wall biosynthesis
MVEAIPVSAVVPTMNRPVILRRMLASLASQSVQPKEIIITDASDDFRTSSLFDKQFDQLNSKIVWQKAKQSGAASQRNQGVEAAEEPFVCFFDDDILFEPECMRRLWDALNSDSTIGGVNAMIVNQRYQAPGFASRLMFTLMHGHREVSFAGRVIGPAINLLPEEQEHLPEVVPVEWLNLGCTIYRREALPSPPFDSVFTGYSLMEDVALSTKVGQAWKLANARTARIYHDSQPADYKSNIAEMACMQLVNRHYVMTKILGRQGFVDYLRLFVWELFQFGVSAAHGHSRRQLAHICKGKLKALTQIRSKAKESPSSSDSMLQVPVDRD